MSKITLVMDTWRLYITPTPNPNSNPKPKPNPDPNPDLK